jgi:hypothetical protein
MQPEAFLKESLESLRDLIGELDRIGAVQNQIFHDAERSSIIG